MEEMDAAVRAKHMRLLGERAPMNRLLSSEEIVNVVLFLASDESSGVQAAELVVDGGPTGRSPDRRGSCGRGGEGVSKGGRHHFERLGRSRWPKREKVQGT